MSKKISMRFIDKNIQRNQSQITDNKRIISVLEDAIKALGFDSSCLYNNKSVEGRSKGDLIKAQMYETTMLKIGILKNDNMQCESKIYALESEKSILLNPKMGEKEKEANLINYHIKQVVLEVDNLFYNDFGSIAFTEIFKEALKYLVKLPKEYRSEIYDSLFNRYEEGCKVASKNEYNRLLHNKNLLLKFLHLVLIEEQDITAAFSMIYDEIINYHHFLQKYHTNEEIYEEKVETIRKSRRFLF